MAAEKTRMSIRFSREAYEILKRIHPSIRSDALSDIVVKAEKRGWINEIKQLQVEKMLEGIGMTIDDVVVMRPTGRTPDNPSAHDGAATVCPLIRESPEREESLQEKLDRKIFL